MVTVDRASAVTQIRWLEICGWAAWSAWLLMRLIRLIGFGSYYTAFVCDIKWLSTTKTEKVMIQIKRVYEPAAKADGERFLVERLWPRGTRKEALPMTAWLKDLAPSNELRQWFNHDPAKWKEFKTRYRAELDGKPESWQPLLAAAKTGAVTLLFSAHDLEHNNALVLKTCLEEQLKRGHKGKSSAGK